MNFGRMGLFLWISALGLSTVHARRVDVSNVSALVQALNGAAPGDTIRVQPGIYKVPEAIQLDGKKRVTLMSANGDPKTTILRGQGFASMSQDDDILRIASSSDIRVEKLGFQECHSYAIQVMAEYNPARVSIVGCRFSQIGTRMIKGSTITGTSAIGGEIIDCHFENTSTPGSNWYSGGNYIAAIDMMALDGWRIARNTMVNVKGYSGGGRAAIFIWVGSKNLVVEDNVIVGCDRGIAFGNPSQATTGAEWHVTNSICRNNFISGGPDAGIELSWVNDVKILHNTIWKSSAAGRALRSIQKITKAEIAYNLMQGQMILEAKTETTLGNVTGALDGYFKNPSAGDLHLTSLALKAFDKAEARVDVRDDFDGNLRPEVGKGMTDVGADEFDSGSIGIAASRAATEKPGRSAAGLGGERGQGTFWFGGAVNGKAWSWADALGRAGQGR